VACWKMPVPLSVTDCVVGEASSVTVSVAVSAPAVEGVKMTLMKHVPTGPLTAAPSVQVVPVTTAKSAPFVP